MHNTAVPRSSQSNPENMNIKREMSDLETESNIIFWVTFDIWDVRRHKWLVTGAGCLKAKVIYLAGVTPAPCCSAAATESEWFWPSEMAFITRLGLWLVLATAGSAHPPQAWRRRIQNREDVPRTSSVTAWPVVLDTGDVYVCTANISYQLPDTLTDIQEWYKSQQNLIEIYRFRFNPCWFVAHYCYSD